MPSICSSSRDSSRSADYRVKFSWTSPTGRWGMWPTETWEPEWRASLHRRLAVALEMRAVDNPIVSEAVGEHYSGGRERQGHRHLTSTALRLWQRSLTAEAWEMSERAVQLAESASGDLSEAEFDRARLDVLRVRAYMSYNRGAWEQAEHIMARCRAWPPSSEIRRSRPKRRWTVGWHSSASGALRPAST